MKKYTSKRQYPNEGESFFSDKGIKYVMLDSWLMLNTETKEKECARAIKWWVSEKDYNNADINTKYNIGDILEKKLNSLYEITNNNIFIAYCGYNYCFIYKIYDPFTNVERSEFLLLPVSEGLEKSIDKAIKQLNKAKRIILKEAKKLSKN